MAEEQQNKDLTNEAEEEVTKGSFLAGIIVLGFLIFIIFKVISFIGGAITEDANPTQTGQTAQQQQEYTDYDAYVNAQVILEKFLKSPSTAEYPVASEATIKRYTEDGFRVESYVDSQNGFGAVVRSDWIVVFQFVGDSVKVLAVVLDGETLYKLEE